MWSFCSKVQGGAGLGGAVTQKAKSRFIAPSPKACAGADRTRVAWRVAHGLLQDLLTFFEKITNSWDTYYRFLPPPTIILILLI